MSKKWYVVHTYSGHENKVRENLQKAIQAARSAELEASFGEILVAKEEFVEMRDGKRKTSKRKTFPSYVIIEMDLSDETRHLVQNVPGGDAASSARTRRPSPSRRTRCAASSGRWSRRSRSPRPTCSSAWATTCASATGPFSGFNGVVDEVNNERGKIKVMVSIFGRQTPVELDFLQVQPV